MTSIVTFSIFLTSLLIQANIIQVQEGAQKFSIHLEENKVLLQDSMKNAIDVLLIHHGNMDEMHNRHICRVLQKGFDINTQEIQLISPESINSKNFDPSSPTNIKSFVTMSHINDGIIAITSDLQLYMLKFDYRELHSNNQDTSLTEEDEKKQPKFASLHWRTDLKKISSTEGQMTELPQLVYDNFMNQAFLVFTDSVMSFSVTSMESDNQSLKVQQHINEWKQRQERGWTKCKNNLMYSAVGAEGIDIYLIGDNKVTFLEGITQRILSQSNHPTKHLIVEDFEVINCEKNTNNCHLLYLFVQGRGINIIKVQLGDNHQITTALIMENIGRSGGEIAMDTFDGKTIISAYKETNHLYYVTEIFIQLESFSWETVSEYTQRTKVVDVKVNGDLGVIQGVNHHQLIFLGVAIPFKYYSSIQPIIMNHGHLRDFDFFDLQLLKDPKGKAESEKFQNDQGQMFDDFIFGITPHKLFVTKYKVTPPGIHCFTEDDQFINKKLLYTAIFNTTTCNLMPFPERNSICSHKKDFSVEVVSTYLYEDAIIFVILLSVLSTLLLLSLLACLFVLYRRFKHDSNSLQNQITQYGSRKNDSMNQSSNQLQIDQSIDKEKGL